MDLDSLSQGVGIIINYVKGEIEFRTPDMELDIHVRASSLDRNLVIVSRRVGCVTASRKSSVLLGAISAGTSTEL